ncbi:MAG: hypothetical protein JXA15_05435 [Spirochaetales bacterium]|nr:hypothetical protein [Spirochaetales bacterium]
MTTKKILAFALIAILAAGAASAQLAIGWSGALYSETELSWSQQMDRFQNGEGIFTGPFAELAFDKLAVGASLNFSEYEEAAIGYVEMVDYDLTLYLQAHFFEYDSFLDPFLEVGFGMIGTDFANAEDDPDEANPLRATGYFEAGAGLGVNVGMLGLFWKINYMFPGEPQEVDYEYTDEYGTYYSGTYTLAEYPISKLKTYLGLKIIF